MANVKITDLAPLTTPATGDKLPIVDVSDTTDSPDGTTKYVEVEDLVATPGAHAASHQNGGSDEISVAGLSGVLGDAQVADKVKESSGPTTLVVGAVADGEFLKRVGSTVVSAVPAGTGAEAGANSDITSMDGLTGALENPTQVIFPEAAAPSTPGAGKVTLYAKSDGLLYSKDDAGTETVVTGGGGGGGVPASSTNILPYSDGSAFQNSPLSRADANTIEQSNGTSSTAIRFNIYGLKNGANYERFRLGYDTGSGHYLIEADKGGTGTQRAIRILIGGTVYWQISAAGHLTAWDSAARLFLNDGAVNNPSLQFGGASGTGFKGMYNPALNDLGFTTSSTYRFRIADAGVMVGANDGFLFSSTALGSGVTSSVGIHRHATGVAEINDGTKGNSGVLLLRGRTFANLPATPVAGMMATVTDSNTATWGATIAGGGANNVLARYNGTNWTVVGI